MTLKLSDKKDIVAEVAALAGASTSVIAAKYSGMRVTQLTELRKIARGAGVQMRVVRNTLARRAFEGTPFVCMDPALVGPLVLAFSKDEPGAAARVFKDYMKKCDKLEVTALSVDGALFPGKDLNRLASLPTRLEAIAQLMGVMKEPVAKFVRTVAEPHSKLVRTFAALRNQKEQTA